MENNITQLLQEWREGNREAEDRLFELVLPRLRRLAQYLIRGERKGHSLQATELVNNMYLRLVKAKDRTWENRTHFFAMAGRAMRRHLIEHARQKPNVELVAFERLEQVLPVSSAKAEVAVTVAHLLEQLAEVRPEWCTLVELKYFLGLTDEEAAEALGMKLRTMQRMWLEVRRYLFERMVMTDAAGQARR